MRRKVLVSRLQLLDTDAAAKREEYLGLSRAKALKAYVAISGDEANMTELLIPLVHDDDLGLDAIELLGYQCIVFAESREKILGVLAKLLSSPDYHTRRYAAYAVRRSGRLAIHVIEPLKQALTDKFDEVREAAAELSSSVVC